MEFNVLASTDWDWSLSMLLDFITLAKQFQTQKDHNSERYPRVVAYIDFRIQKLKQEMSKSFAMKDLGPARQILGMQIVRERKAKKLVLSQEKYIEKVLHRFSMDKAKYTFSYALQIEHETVSDEKEDMKKVPYASAVGSLIYAMVCTRPDIAHAVGVVSRKPILCGYTDSNMAGYVDTRKSTSGYFVTFAGGAVSWQSRLQKCVALSTTEAELIAICIHKENPIPCHLSKVQVQDQPIHGDLQLHLGLSIHVRFDDSHDAHAESILKWIGPYIEHEESLDTGD
uniref:Reverse transcriptase Ty1/copia-type domain-containing protein n=1 Tax=Solanum lycopersicum TaxID=4081 RepID=A0A3Q7GJI6_SOLLC